MVQFWHNFHIPSFSGYGPILVLADDIQFSLVGAADAFPISNHYDRIPSTTPGAEPPRDARDSGSARSHSTHLETSSSDRP